jgi:hypothetical protein
MKSRKPKTSEPSLRDKLSAAYLEAFQKDFEVNGVAAIEALRKESPAKYSEIAARLIAATEPPPKADGFEADTSMQAIGRRLLKSVGTDESAVTDDMIARAIEANDQFIARLEQIARDAQGEELN